MNQDVRDIQEHEEVALRDDIVFKDISLVVDLIGISAVLVIESFVDDFAQGCELVEGLAASEGWEGRHCEGFSLMGSLWGVCYREVIDIGRFGGHEVVVFRREIWIGIGIGNGGVPFGRLESENILAQTRPWRNAWQGYRATWELSR